VVEQNGNVVTFVDVLTHAFIPRRSAAGNRPKEIETRLQRNPDLPKWDILIRPTGG
jgi:hypothetical protein